MRKALINKQTGIVENIISIEPDAIWTPSKDFEVVDEPSGDIGDIYNSGSFTKPISVIEPKVKTKIELLEERLIALEAKVR